MSKLDKMRRELENAFRDELHAAFFAKYGAHIETNFNLFSMQTYSCRQDGQDLTQEQHDYIQGYSEAFGKAITMVLLREADDYYQREVKRNAREAA